MSDTTTPVQVEFSRFVDCGKLPSGGKSFTIEADSRERKALESRLSIDSLGYLTAEFTVTPGKAGLVVLRGRLKANIAQTCVVSLKPVLSDIDITIDRTYGLAADDLLRDQGEPDEYGNLSGGGQTKDLPDPPDRMEKGGIDLGEVASEELAVEIDPFPRLAGAELKASAGLGGGLGPEEVKNPFAVLETLKKKLE